MAAGNQNPLKCTGGHPSSSTPSSSGLQGPPPHRPCVMSYIGANLVSLVDSVILLAPFIDCATNPSVARDISSLRDDLAFITYDDRDADFGVEPVSIQDYTLGPMQEDVEDVLRHTVPKITGAAVKARQIHLGLNDAMVKVLFNVMSKNLIGIASCLETCRYEVGRQREAHAAGNIAGVVNVHLGLSFGVRMLDAFDDDDVEMKMRATAGARSLKKILLLFRQPNDGPSCIASWEDILSYRKKIQRVLGFSFYQICLVVHELRMLAIQKGRNHGFIFLVLDHLNKVAGTLWICRDSLQRRHASWTAKEAVIDDITAGVNARYRFLLDACQTILSLPRQSPTDGNRCLEIRKSVKDLMLFAAVEVPFAARKLELLSMNSGNDGLFWQPEKLAAKYREQAKCLGNYLKGIVGEESEDDDSGRAAAAADDSGLGVGRAAV